MLSDDEAPSNGNEICHRIPCTQHTQFGSAAFDIENIICFLTKRATLMRRSTVLSLPPQLVFSGRLITFLVTFITVKYNRVSIPCRNTLAGCLRTCLENRSF